MDILTDQRDLISQSALLKHRRAIFAGGTLQEYVPVSAILAAERVDAEEVTRCNRCCWFRAESSDANRESGFCICWGSETERDQYCSRAKPMRD